MSAGIRATVAFESPAECPVAAIAASTDTVVDRVSRSVAPTPDTPSVSEVVVESETVPEDAPTEPIFSYGGRQLYRVTHDGDVDCPCRCLGRHGCPVHRYVADRETVTLVFHAVDYEQLQTVIAALREGFPDVDIRRLVRSPVGDAPGDTVFVDRGRLTARQLEVLRTAYEMGYFERPRGANATEVAAELGIGQSTFAEHLAAGQTKLLGDVFEDGS